MHRIFPVMTVLVLLGCTATAAPHRCAGPVAEAAARGGITPEQIKRTVFIDVTDGGRDGSFVVGYEAWVDMNTCKGTVVAKMSLECEIEETYTRGACKFSGLKNFR